MQKKRIFNLLQKACFPTVLVHMILEYVDFSLRLIFSRKENLTCLIYFEKDVFVGHSGSWVCVTSPANKNKAKSIPKGLNHAGWLYHPNDKLGFWEVDHRFSPQNVTIQIIRNANGSRIQAIPSQGQDREKMVTFQFTQSMITSVFFWNDLIIISVIQDENLRWTQQSSLQTSMNSACFKVLNVSRVSHEWDNWCVWKEYVVIQATQNTLCFFSLQDIHKPQHEREFFVDLPPPPSFSSPYHFIQLLPVEKRLYIVQAGSVFVLE